jgi:hypothetical protein
VGRFLPFRIDECVFGDRHAPSAATGRASGELEFRGANVDIARRAANVAEEPAL